ncbi:MAG: hypothetical protein ABR510_02815 [Trueperaceae bacterium]
MRARRGLRTVALATAAVALTACTPLFAPPVPTDTLAPAPAWRLAGEAELRATVFSDDPHLRVRFRFDAVAADAWVAVQWFGPTGGERASVAVWVARGDEGRPFAVDLPADVAVEPGAWRALISVGGRVLRQLDAVVPPATTP